MPTTNPLSAEEKRNKLTLWISDMSEDEIKVAYLFIGKFMGEGRKEYGPLNLKTEKRTLIQMMNESADEVADGLFYMFVKILMQIEAGYDTLVLHAPNPAPDPGGLY